MKFSVVTIYRLALQTHTLPTKSAILAQNQHPELASDQSIRSLQMLISIFMILIGQSLNSLLTPVLCLYGVFASYQGDRYFFEFLPFSSNLLNDNKTVKLS